MSQREKKLRRGLFKKSNRKAFFSYAKKFNKSSSKIGPLKDKNGILQADPEAKANILQNQYTKVFSKPMDVPETEENIEMKIEDIEFTIDDIKEAIKSTPVSSAPGPDKIPIKLLQECVDQLAPEIYKIWRKSLDASEIPDILKLQTIVPIFKKGNKSAAENYRPVSLLSNS